MTIPSPSQHHDPQILRGQEAVDYLNQRGISVEAVRTALEQGEVDASTATSYDPVTAAGLKRWMTTVGTLREKLAKTSEWEIADPQNRPIAIHKDSGRTIAVVGGNSKIGIEDGKPNVARKKGAATEHFYKSGVGVQLVLTITTSSPSKDSPQEDDTSPQSASENWVLLYYRDKAELRAEISWPLDCQNGYFTGFHVRILLDPISYAIDDKQPLDIGGSDVDFSITTA